MVQQGVLQPTIVTGTYDVEAVEWANDTVISATAEPSENVEAGKNESVSARITVRPDPFADLPFSCHQTVRAERMIEFLPQELISNLDELLRDRLPAGYRIDEVTIDTSTDPEQPEQPELVLRFRLQEPFEVADRFWSAISEEVERMKDELEENPRRALEESLSIYIDWQQ